MIDTVKIQGNGYLVDGCMSVPKAEGNRDYQEVLEWIASGNVVEPEFTEAELEQQVLYKKIAEAKAYLASTDFKMTVDYYPTMTPEQQEELSTKRAESRAFLKEQGL